jgi:hypothetical protein
VAIYFRMSCVFLALDSNVIANTIRATWVSEGE